ncbi:MAG: hypothetical protein GY926_15165 [bacterium]|nr:hypothetical protein [bacterium]
MAIGNLERRIRRLEQEVFMTDPGNMLTYKQFQWIVWNAEQKCIEAGLEVENPKPMPGPIPPPLRMIEEWRERFFRNPDVLT